LKKDENGADTCPSCGGKELEQVITSFIARTSSKRQHKPPRGFGQLQNFQREFSINRFLPFPSPSFKAGRSQLNCWPGLKRREVTPHPIRLYALDIFFPWQAYQTAQGLEVGFQNPL
jgi:hypothetical protein